MPSYFNPIMENNLEKKNGTYMIKKQFNAEMKVEPVLYVNNEIIEPLIKEHDERPEGSTFRQLSNVSSLPTILSVSSLPDVHCGYSFPIGTSAGFDLSDPNCIISVEGIGHDINCGVRSIATNLTIDDILSCQESLAETLFKEIPTGIYIETPSERKGATQNTKDVKKNTAISTKDNEITKDKEDGTHSNIRENKILHELKNTDLDLTKNQSIISEKDIYTKTHTMPELTLADLNQILNKGVPYLVEKNYVSEKDLDLIENGGAMSGDSKKLSQKAKSRGLNQIGSLGSGNHYLEIQKVTDIYDSDAANHMNIHSIGQIIITIHTGSRGLGFQTCEDYLTTIKKIVELHENPKSNNHEILNKEAVVKINTCHMESIYIKDQTVNGILKKQGYLKYFSDLGKDYYSAMCSAANFAFCNRALIDYGSRKIIELYFQNTEFNLIYDVCHNIAKVEKHPIFGSERDVLVHRKGASRAFPPNHPEIPRVYNKIGQPVLVGGSMGTCSYILVGAEQSLEKTLGSACHGAGRLLSRSQSNKTFTFDEIQEILKKKGIIVKCGTKKGLVEEAPGCYKNVDLVVDICEQHKITRKVVRVEPVIVIKG